MALALVVLAIGSVLAGYVGVPAVLGGSNWFEHFLAPALGVSAAESGAADAGTELTLMLISSGVAVGGIALAAYFSLKNRSAVQIVDERFAGIHRLLENKYYVDDIYNAAVVEPVRIISEQGLWKGIDVRVIDGAVNGVADTVGAVGRVLRRVQTGSVRAYAASLVLGVVLVLGYCLWR
jgi:NADH-quinone oxidoreductase subunit L